MTTTSAFAPRFDLSNVFLSREPVAVAAEAGEPSYALVKSGPAVNADEVESHVDAVEITVRWGSQVLKVTHLDRGQSFFVGEGCELALPEDIIGAAKAPIVLARGNGCVVIAPPGSHGTVSLKSGTSTNFSGANELPLTDGMSVHLEVGAVRADGTTGEPITFEIGTVRKGRVAPVGFLSLLAGSATGFVGLSFLGHAAIVASMAMFMPSMNNQEDGIDRDQILMMQKFLNASAERAAEEPEPLPGADAAGGSSTSGEAHKGESGEAGTTAHVTTQGRMAVRGTETHAELSPKQERALAAEFGMAGLLASQQFDPKAPQSAWATTPVGNEKDSAWGHLFAPEIGDAAGYGLGLTGTGEGGGGPGLGVGMGRIGTIGGGGGSSGGLGNGNGDGMGSGHGVGGTGHVVKQIAPVREGKPQIIGRLPADVIQRIVRQNFGRFRNCYEPALRTNPSLSGRVTTRFTIGRDGAVIQANDGGSDLPDQNVVSCIVRSFQSLSFPSPEGGIANVTYPIILTPGE